MAPTPRLTRARIAAARARYDAGEPLAAIGADLRLAPRAFLAWRRKQGWPLRPRVGASPPAAAPPAETKPGPAAPAPPAEPDAPVDSARLGVRLARALNAQLTAVENRLSRGTTTDGERDARTLASIVKTYAELRRIEAQEPAAPGETQNDEGPPRDLAALRRELARVVERLAGERPGG